MVKILITDNVTLNSGDAAILAGMLGAIARVAPAAEIRIHCQPYDHVRRHYPELPMRRSLTESSRVNSPRYFWRWPARERYLVAGFHKLSWLTLLAPLLTTRAERASIADFHWADVVISSGGGFTTDNYYFDHLLAGYGLGLALGKKMVILGQTLGPFLEERNLHAVGDVISRFDLVVVRDAQSLEIGRRMGIPEGVLALAADMTFNVPSPPTLEAPCSGPRPRIGVSVRKWSYPNSDAKAEHASYVARMAAALDLLIERTGAAITFLSTCQGEPAYPYRDDEVAAEIRRAMRLEGKTKIDVEFNTPQRFMSKIADFDMIIGTRMHACILAMLTGVPAVNVEYEFKSRELFRRMGLEDLVLGIATFTPEQLVCMVERVLGDRPSVAAKITAEIAQLRRLNAAAENRLGEILRG